MNPRAIDLPRRPSLILWDGLSVVMVVLAYLFASTLVLACLALSVIAFHRWEILLGAGALLVAASVFSYLLPRRDKFIPPGPRLDSSSQPRLFAEIERIAASFNEPPPAEVYLSFDITAVGQRGGILGLGSRRVMLLGLPLLSAVSLSEFRAIVAHEFGHFYSGDTRMGPWVYTTHQAMERSLSALQSDDGILKGLSRFAIVGVIRDGVLLLLIGYWKLFLRVMSVVSRAREYRADELACAVAGKKALIDGLCQSRRAVAVWPGFWKSQINSSFDDGFRPPLAQTFSQFFAKPGVKTASDRMLRAELQNAKARYSDTHPPLSKRIAAAERYGFPFRCWTISIDWKPNYSGRRFRIETCPS